MANTKTLKIITSEEVRVSAYQSKSTVTIDNPEVIEMLSEVAWEDIVTYIQSEKTDPDEVFTDDQLYEWAEKNGYDISARKLAQMFIENFKKFGNTSKEIRDAGPQDLTS